MFRGLLIVALLFAQSPAEQQYNLGVKYQNGDGVPKDPAKAAEWYTKAAEQAFKWAALAAEAGHAEAVQFMDYLTGMMSRDQISEAQQLAREWKPRQP